MPLPADHTRPFGCPVCKNRFTTREIRNSHVLRHENADKFECNQIVNDPERSSERPFPSKVYPEQSNGNAHHPAGHSENDHRERRWKCATCGKRFLTKFRLKRHYVVHSDERPFPCDACPMRFKQKQTLQRHYLDMHSEKKFICETCGKGFGRSLALKTHLYMHSEERPFECALCPQRKFTCKANLRKHQYDYHTERFCGNCSEHFHTIRAFQKHLRTHSNNRFDCVTCGVSFKLEKHLQKHLTRHSISRREASKQRRLARGTDPEVFGVNGQQSVNSGIEWRRLADQTPNYTVEEEDVDESGEDERRSSGSSTRGRDFQESEPSDLDEQSGGEGKPDDRPPHCAAIGANLKVVFDVEYRAPESP